LLDHRGQKTDHVDRVADWHDENVEHSEQASDDQGKRKVKDMANELVYFLELFLSLAEDYHQGRKDSEPHIKGLLSTDQASKLVIPTHFVE
jgi:hypothetical protein